MISTNGQLVPWIRALIGGAQPLHGWWAPVAQHHKREVGAEARGTRLTGAARCPTPIPMLSDLKRRVLPATGSPIDFAVASAVPPRRRHLPHAVTAPCLHLRRPSARVTATTTPTRRGHRDGCLGCTSYQGTPTRCSYPLDLHLEVKNYYQWYQSHRSSVWIVSGVAV